MIGTKALSTRRGSNKRKKREEIVESERAVGGLARQVTKVARALAPQEFRDLVT